MRRSLSDTLSRLKAFAPALGADLAPAVSPRLSALRSFGSNPGNLDGWFFAPGSAERVPLVVVLHGCTQSAAGYDRGSGWSELAERHGFAVLFAEQKRVNNPNLCFNWFDAEDTRRGRGEALSIRQMVAAMLDRHRIDPARLFVTGLSAGGAMTSTMLATYPEVFAGGAIIAGLPYGAADSVPEAFERMRGYGHPDADALAAKVRAASDHHGRWPTVSVWQGSADATVAPMNADAIVGQWRILHGVADKPDKTGTVDGFPHHVWLDDAGRPVIETYSITGMGHGTPLDVDGKPGGGTAMAHMLDVGIASTRRIAASWHLLGKEKAEPVAAKADAIAPTSATVLAKAIPERVQARPVHARRTSPPKGGIQATIEAALRSAGLMR